MSTLSKPDLLFRLKREDMKICPGYQYNAIIAAAPKSPKHTSSGSAPRISMVAKVMEHILCDRVVSALYNAETGDVYSEVGTSKGVLQYYYQPATDTVWSTDGSERHALIPIFLSMLLHRPVELVYTAASLESAVKNYEPSSKIMRINDLANLCDCYYYDIVDVKPDSFNINTFTPDTQASVESSIGAGKLGALPETPLTPYIGTTFNYVTFAARTTSKAGKASNSFDVTATWLQSCKDGEFEIGFDWRVEDQERIVEPEFLDSFIPNREHVKLTRLISHELNLVVDRINSGREGIAAIKDNYINAILVGRPGTGKTTTAEALSATLGLPIYTVKASKNTEEDTFEGMNKVSAGSFVFKDTNFLKGYEHGGIIVLEEFNLADPGVMQGALGQAIEYPFILMRDGYEEVHRHPLCVIISTMNTGTEGSRDPNQALTSRSPFVYTMDDPKDDEFLAILESKGYEKKNCKSVYKAYRKILDYLLQVAHAEELTMCVTLRHCLGALKLMSIGEGVYDAIYDTMIGSIGIYDLDMANDVFKNAVQPLSL